MWQSDTKDAFFLRQLFDLSQDLICVLDAEGCFIKVNPAFLKMLGWGEPALLGRPVFELAHPDDMEMTVDELERLKLETTKANFCHRLKTLEGEYLVIQWMAVPESPQGLIFAIGRDVTKEFERCQYLTLNEERLKVIFEQSQSFMCTHSLDGEFLSVNEALSSALGYSREEMSRLSLFDIIPKTEHEGLKTYLEKIMNEGIAEGKMLTQRKDGKKRIFLFNNVLQSGDGGASYVIGNAVDITEQHFLEMDLKSAKIQAEKASQAKSEFLANMSHEIRTPLNGVIGFTDLLLKTKLSDVQLQHLSIVNRSANALLEMVNNLLDFSKIESGKLELDIERCDLAEICQQAAAMINELAGKKKVEMKVSLSEDLPLAVRADSMRLKQILVNLLSNAIKFTEQGEIELKAEPFYALKDQKIRFSVRDTGVGIHPHKQEKIFDAFSQEDGSATKKYGGTGLGLTISNKLLNLMDSKLQLMSSPAQGSLFYFDLYLEKAEDERSNQPLFSERAYKRFNPWIFAEYCDLHGLDKPSMLLRLHDQMNGFLSELDRFAEAEDREAMNVLGGNLHDLSAKVGMPTLSEIGTELESLEAFMTFDAEMLLARARSEIEDILIAIRYEGAGVE